MYAFPRPLPKGEFVPDEALRILKDSAGMTLRDYFAAKVMAAQFAGGEIAMPDDLELRAAIAYKAADFMLRRRDK